MDGVTRSAASAEDARVTDFDSSSNFHGVLALETCMPKAPSNMTMMSLLMLISNVAAAAGGPIVRVTKSSA